MRSPAPARCRRAPSAWRSKRPTGDRLAGDLHSRRTSAARTDSDARLWRQCLERPGRRRISASGLSRTRTWSSFHYRGYAPSQGSPSAEALIADAPADLSTSRSERSKPRARRRGRLQHRHRRRRATLPAQRQARRGDPRDAVRFAEGGRPAACTRGCRSGRYSAMRSMPRRRSRKSSVPVAIIAAERDEIVSAERTDALRKRSQPRRSTRRSRAPATTTFTRRSEFHAAHARGAGKASHFVTPRGLAATAGAHPYCLK